MGADYYYVYEHIVYNTHFLPYTVYKNLNGSYGIAMFNAISEGIDMEYLSVDTKTGKITINNSKKEEAIEYFYSKIVL